MQAENTTHIIDKTDSAAESPRREAIFIAVCFLTGLMAGTGAFLLKRFTAIISRIATDGLGPDAIPWRFLWLPVVGFVLAALFQRYVVRQQLDHGTKRINDALLARNYSLPWSTMFSPIIGASLTLGFGGSAGSEGPIAYASAAMGSNLGRWFRLTPAQLTALVAIGGGAGIAGIFKAPVGGFFFAVEVLLISLSTVSLIGLATACITSGMTAYTLSGFTPDVVFRHIPDFDPHLLVWALPLGLVCGLYSVYYTFLIRKIYTASRNVTHPVAKWIASGVLIGLMIFTLPSLYGEGYQVIAKILDGNGIDALTFGSILGHIGGMTPLVTLLLLTAAAGLLKSPASAITNDGGGVAGNFAPTIFAGAIVGFFFAAIATMVLGMDVSLAALVFMAMGGVMAGAVRAPIMAMFIVVEMTGAYALFLPLILTSAISFGVVRLCALRSAHTAR